MRTFKKVVNSNYNYSEEEPTLTPSLPLKLHLSPKPEDQEPMPRLVDIKQLARILGLTVSAVRWHKRKGRIQAIPLGRRVLFNPEDVIAKLSQQSGRDSLSLERKLFSMRPLRSR